MMLGLCFHYFHIRSDTSLYFVVSQINQYILAKKAIQDKVRLKNIKLGTFEHKCQPNLFTAILHPRRISVHVTSV